MALNTNALTLGSKVPKGMPQQDADALRSVTLDSSTLRMDVTDESVDCTNTPGVATFDDTFSKMDDSILSDGVNVWQGTTNGLFLYRKARPKRRWYAGSDWSQAEGPTVSYYNPAQTVEVPLTGWVAVSPASEPAPVFELVPFEAILVATAAQGATGPAGGALPSIYFGDGSDGDVEVSTTITMTRDMYYGHLTMKSGGSIKTGNYILHVLGTLDLTEADAGAINCTGGDGDNSSTAYGALYGTAAGYVSYPTSNSRYSVGGGAYATDGGNASSTNGVQAAAVAVYAHNGGRSGAGGKGGDSGSYTGGASRSATILSATYVRPILFVTHEFFKGAYQLNGGIGGPGGGGGAGNTLSLQEGGGGGGGGAAGGVCAVFAQVIHRNENTPAGVISVKGGNGGNGFRTNNANGGGGGGGSGGGAGWLYLVCSSLTGTAKADAIDITGGNGGNGGTGSGTGTDGTGGGSGESGRAIVIKMEDDSVAHYFPEYASQAASGTTGGTATSALFSL